MTRYPSLFKLKLYPACVSDRLRGSWTSGSDCRCLLGPSLTQHQLQNQGPRKRPRSKRKTNANTPIRLGPREVACSEVFPALATARPTTALKRTPTFAPNPAVERPVAEKSPQTMFTRGGSLDMHGVQERVLGIVRLGQIVKDGDEKGAV